MRDIVQEHRWSMVFFGVLLLAGICAFADYGLTWDEEFQRAYGKYLYHYVWQGDQTLFVLNNRYHGPVLQYVLYQFELWSGLTETAEVYQLRHFLTMLFSFVGLVYFYRLLLLIFRSRYMAVLGVLLLVLSPRIMAHSFYNSKDASFMYMFIIAFYTMVQVLRNLGWRSLTIHALTCALLIDIRILGVFVPFFTIVLLVPRSVVSLRAAFRSVKLLAMYGLLLMAGVVAFWPILWHDPLQELLNALTTMSAYPWDYRVLFLGQFLASDQLPWYYLPWWIVITTPLFHLVLIAIGAVVWIFASKQMTWYIRAGVLLWAVIPLTVIIAKDAIVYDGWRHVFFVYPALIIIAVAGARFLAQRIGVHVPTIVLCTLLLLPLGFTTHWMVRNHPHQYVFFNAAVAEGAWKNYEMDYWGGSFKQALEWLLAFRPEGKLLVATSHYPGKLNHKALPTDQRERVQPTSRDSAQYFISIHRFPEEFVPYLEQRYPYRCPLHQISVDGNVIIGVYELQVPLCR